MRPIMKRLHWLSVLIVVTLAFNSCGKDEPELPVGYYLGIQSQVALDLSDSNDSQGTSATIPNNVISVTIVKMKKALREAYPVETLSGNDAAVLTACDSVYRAYRADHEPTKVTVCSVVLYRTRLDGVVVKNSTALKTYHFTAMPDIITPEGL